MEIEKIMYTVGKIARCIYPDGDIPNNIAEIIIRRPLSGIGLISKTPEMRKADQEELAVLMDDLPSDLTDPKNGVSLVYQGSFWIGFYHYMTAQENAKMYGAKELTAAGEALYGKQWQTDLARDLKLSDARRIRAWLSGERKIPVGIWADIAALLRGRQISIDVVLKSLT